MAEGKIDCGPVSGSGTCNAGHVCTPDDKCITEAEADRQQKAAQDAHEEEIRRKAKAKQDKADSERGTRGTANTSAAEHQRAVGQQQLQAAEAAEAARKASQEKSRAGLNNYVLQRQTGAGVLPPTASPETLPGTVGTGQVVPLSPTETRRLARPTTPQPAFTGDLAKGAEDQKRVDELLKSLPAPAITAPPPKGPVPVRLPEQKTVAEELQDKRNAERQKGPATGLQISESHCRDEEIEVQDSWWGDRCDTPGMPGISEGASNGRWVRHMRRTCVDGKLSNPVEVGVRYCKARP